MWSVYARFSLILESCILILLSFVNIIYIWSVSNPEMEAVVGLGEQFNSARNQASIALNMIVAIFSSFGICYYIGTQMGKDKARCMIYGVIGATLMMILEMVLFITRALRVESSFESGAAKGKYRHTSAGLTNEEYRSNGQQQQQQQHISSIMVAPAPPLHCSMPDVTLQRAATVVGAAANSSTRKHCKTE